jgi:glutaredoxin 3
MLMPRAAKVTVYSRAWCGYCAAAKKLLNGKQAEYDTVDVEADSSQLQTMIDRSGGRTVPQIFINDDSIGGYTELATLERDGRLDALLDQPPAAD